MRPVRLAVPLLTGLLLAGCGDGDDTAEDLRAQLAAREQATTDLEGRVEELEERLDASDEDDEDADPLARVADLDELEERLGERLDELDTSLAGVDERVDEQRDGRAALRGELEGTAADLRSTLADAQGELESLRGEASELRTLYETLRDRLDEQQRQG